MSRVDELLFVVDEEDNPLEPRARGEVHASGIWHRVAHVWIIDHSGNVLCQQRALNKDLNPGFWECFFGGHLDPKESYRNAAVRELREETGIDAHAHDLEHWRIYRYTSSDGRNKEFMGIYVCRRSVDIADVCCSDTEVQEVSWKPLVEVRERIVRYGQHGWTYCGYELDLIDELLNAQ